VQVARGKRYLLGRADVLPINAARERARKYLLNGGPPQDLARPTDAANMGFGAWREKHYEPWYKAHHRNSKGLNNFKQFAAWFDRKPLKSLTVADTAEWSTFRLGSNVKPATVRRNLVMLRAALERAVEWGHLPANPLISYKLPKVSSAGVVRYLTDQEEARLRAAVRPIKRERKDRARIRTLVLLALNSGMRLGELFNLRWQDVDLRSAQITVRGEGTKSERTRHIPLPSETVALLKDWQKVELPVGDALVFPNDKGRKLYKINRAWNVVRSAAKLGSFRFHDLRHSYASKLVMRGVDLYTVAKLLGHADVRVTQIYAHLAPDHLRDAVKVLEQ
jgi:integrase